MAIPTGVEAVLASNSFGPGILSRFQFLHRVLTTHGALAFCCFAMARHMHLTMHIALYGGQSYRQEERHPKSVQRTGARRFAQSETRTSVLADKKVYAN
jgi:hypothetical protein